MAYVQSTASSINDVLSQACAFAVANAGFSDEGMVVIGEYNVYRIKKGEIYWSFQSSPSAGLFRIIGRMSYSISSTAVPTNLNGQADWAVGSLWGFSGPYSNLYMYTESGAVHVVIEVTTGVFTIFSFGNIVKADTFVGGEYMAAAYMDTKSTTYFQNVDYAYNTSLFTGGWIDSKNSCNYHSYIRNIRASGQSNNEGDFARFGRNLNSNSAQGCTWGGIIQALMNRSPNTATLRSILLPNYITLYDYTNGLWMLAGHVPGMRIVMMNYTDPGEIILNNWQCFPYVSKDGNSLSYPVTGNYGLAFKRA